MRNHPSPGSQNAARQVAGEDPVWSDTVHPLLSERTTDQYPAPDLVIDRQMDHAEQWRIRRSEKCRHLCRRQRHVALAPCTSFLPFLNGVDTPFHPTAAWLAKVRLH